MDKISLRDFGPIKNVNLEFGDLTIVVGEQALGKSLVLETFKLVADSANVVSNLERYSFAMTKKERRERLLNAYFGEGLASIWKKDTQVEFNGRFITPNALFKSNYQENENFPEKVFYIPAQRILCLPDGRARNFMEFSPSTPYVVRQFSETLRLFMQFGLNGNSQVFPINTRLKGFIRNTFDKAIFHQGIVQLRDKSGVKEMSLEVDNLSLPFMTWSAGQKEFMPLLLGFYCLTGAPTKVVDKDKYEYVIIEEPEMGLHPKAILAVILQSLELIQMGYKVVISTHSPVILEFAWAFNILRIQPKAYSAIASLFEVSAKHGAVHDMLKGIEKKEIKAFLLHRDEDGGVGSTDISSLDVGADDDKIASWGGISSFAERASELVAASVNEFL